MVILLILLAFKISKVCLPYVFLVMRSPRVPPVHVCIVAVMVMMHALEGFLSTYCTDQ